jgi:hypothetical protein
MIERLSVPSVVLGCALSLVACGDAAKPAAGSGSAAAKSSAPAASAKPAASASAAAAPPSSAAPAGDAAEPAEIKPDDLLKQLKLPDGSSPQKVPDLEGFMFIAPKGAKLAVSRTGRVMKWGTLSVGSQSGAILIANHEQDDGEKCLKLADAKKKLGGAKIVRELNLTSEPKQVGEKYTDYGEHIELVVYERDGKRGFYAHKEFNHGDDSTHVCCAAGGTGDVAELKGTAEAADVDALSSVCLSMTFEF